MNISELLRYKWEIILGGLFTAIIAPLIVERIKGRWRRKSAGEASKETTININIAGVEELRKRVERLEWEQGKKLPTEKIESCFIPGVEELEKAKKLLLQYGQEAQAEYHLEEAIKFFICAADALPCYETFFNLASAYDDYCDYENAKENCEKAIRHDPAQPGGHNGLGIVYDKTGDYPKAEEYFRQALATAEKLTDRQAKLVWQASALTNLGNVYYQTGQMKQALEHYQQALKIHREIGNKLGEAHALMGMGLVYADTDRMEQALKHHQQALKICREIGHKLGEAQALGNLGTVYKDTGRMEQVLEHYQQALKIFQEIGNKLEEASALNNLGSVYYQTDQIEQALEHYQRALKIYRDIGSKFGEAGALGNLGTVYHQTNQMNQARKHYLLARVIFQGIGAGHLVKQVDENLAKLPGG